MPELGNHRDAGNRAPRQREEPDMARKILDVSTGQILQVVVPRGERMTSARENELKMKHSFVA